MPLPTVPGNRLIPDGDGWIEIDEDGVPLGRWEWNDEEEMWIFDEDIPLGSIPNTGDSGVPVHLFFLMGISLIGIGVVLGSGRRKAENHK